MLAAAPGETIMRCRKSGILCEQIWPRVLLLSSPEERFSGVRDNSVIECLGRVALAVKGGTRHGRYVLSAVVAAALVLAMSRPAAADGPDGQKVYTRTCGQCHGTPTEGAEGPKLVPLPYEPDKIRDIVRFGNGEMKALADSSITDDELTAVLAYLSSLDKKGK